MFKAIIDAGEQLRDDKSLRAVVLSGNGRGFCAGLDMDSFAKMGDGDKAAAQGGSETKSLLDTDGQVENFAQRLRWFEYLQVPVIAALHGVAYGGGAQIALGADIRCTGLKDVGDGNQMGVSAGYEHYPDLARLVAHGRGKAAYFHRPGAQQ